jgi:hypothetical protein
MTPFAPLGACLVRFQNKGTSLMPAKSKKNPSSSFAPQTRHFDPKSVKRSHLIMIGWHKLGKARFRSFAK